MRKVLDVASLEASLLQQHQQHQQQQQQKQQKQQQQQGDYSEVIEFNDDELNDETFGDEAVVITGIKKSFRSAAVNMSYVDTCAVSTSPCSRPPVTVEELEAQLASGARVTPVGAGPPPGLVTSSSKGSTGTAPPISTLISGLKQAAPAASCLAASSTAPLSLDDPNRGFMNRFERELIQRIHTHQLTTDNPHMDDFYYQSLTKKRAASASNAAAAASAAPLLYFPLPSVADREREFHRRQQRRARREREMAAKEGREPENLLPVKSTKESSGEALELVLGKVTHSSSRKPRQQLQIPSTFAEGDSGVVLVSLHERVLTSIESVYAAVLSVEDCYLRAEGAAVERGEGAVPSEEVEKRPEFAELLQTAQLQVAQELGLQGNRSAEAAADHEFIHFLTIPKGKGILSRALKILSSQQRERFLFKLVKFFDFLDVVRPETPVAVVDAFIASVLSPLVAFVGEAEWETVLSALRDVFAKRSFVWIALTKAGMVLLCILLSRLEILKAGEEVAAEVEEAARVTERIFDALEGHLAELFTVRVADNREFYAWQFLALLAMNVDSERKRNMIMELRDNILVIVESGEESSIHNLNVFLNALGLDASQLA